MFVNLYAFMTLRLCTRLPKTLLKFHGIETCKYSSKGIMCRFPDQMGDVAPFPFLRRFGSYFITPYLDAIALQENLVLWTGIRGRIPLPGCV